MNVFISCLWFLCFNIDVIVNGSLQRPGCPRIIIRNGMAKLRSRARMVRFTCNKGFLLAGERHSTCLRGLWDPSPPKCVRPTCKPIGNQTNNEALMIYPTHSGAVQYFFCKAGYTLKGPNAVFCDGQKWDNNVPICLRSNTKPKLFCDFESTDLCGYTHDLNHDFDWRRENYNTPSGSIGTGPSFDHTKGVLKDGYYMYIESTSRIENDTARLISPVYDKTDGEVCLEFFYHMYGATMGTLRIYLKKARETWNLSSTKAIFSKSGNQGNKWFRGYERLGKIDDEFQIIFEGVRGSGYVSDIAIDDVKVIMDCKEEEIISTTMEAVSSTEVVPIIDSCNKRCGLKEKSSNDSYHLTCDCDDDCFMNNRCCPDYYGFCNIGTTESDAITTVADIFTTSVQHPIAAYTTLFVKATTYRPTTLIPTKATTSKTPTAKLTQPTRPTTFLPNISKPIIHIQPPPTPPEINRKIFLTEKSTTLSNPEIDQSKPNGKYSDEESNDVENVPIPPKNDESRIVNIDDDSSISKEYWSDENDNRVDTIPYQTNFSVNDKLLSQLAPSSEDVNVLATVVSVVGAVVVICIVVFVVLRRCRWPNRRRNFTNGESQSDVRFLTSEELLDLSLDTE